MNSYEALLEQAEALQGENQLPQAAARCREAIMLAPKRADAYIRLALLQHAEGNRFGAIKAFNAAAERAPKDASIRHNLGVLHFQLCQWPQAAENFESALAIEPDYAEALYAFARLRQKQERPADAAELFRRSFNADPSNARAFEQWQMLTPRILPQAEDVSRYQAEPRRLRIGFVSIWFERGQAYVTRALRDACALEHETFVFAREGSVYGVAQMETGGYWHVPNLTVHDSYEIDPNVLVKWISDNALDVIIFNEEYDWNIVRAARASGVTVLTYLDYYKDEWRPLMGLYDGVLCSTLRTYHLVKGLCKAHFIGWGMPSDLYAPRPAEAQYTFFHNAGWLGINYRKMTPAVILAFDAISQLDPSLSLLVHAQVPLEKMPPLIARIVRENPQITYRAQTVGAPGLYHLGKIYVYPSKLDGLGLSLLEAMSCGLACIATDAPPMNEFVRDGVNGYLVRAAGEVTRHDNIAFPEQIVDVNELAIKMYRLGRDEAAIAAFGAQARRDVLEKFSADWLARRTLAAIAYITQTAETAVHA